jgi:hypothetical protein
LTALPPEDSAVWDRMGDDIAAERWPVPSMFGWIGVWYRGAPNELHRRATFRRQLKRRLAARRWWWPGFTWSLLAALRLWTFLTDARAKSRDLYLAIAMAIVVLLIVAEELAFRHQFDQSYQRYVGQREPASAL